MLDAPHSMMNKFFGPGDANFILVSGTVKEMVKAAGEIVVSQGEGIHSPVFATNMPEYA